MFDPSAELQLFLPVFGPELPGSSEKQLSVVSYRLSVKSFRTAVIS